MKNPIPILFLLLGIWIAGGAFLHRNNSCCGGAAATTSAITESSPLRISDGTQAIAANAQNLRFALAGSTPIIPDPVKTEYAKVAEYLKNNSEKSLLLTGLYQTNETNDSPYENLGFGRAEALKKYLVGLGVAAGQIKTASAIDDQAQVINQEVIGPVNYAFVTTSRNISLADAALFSAATNDNLVFAKSVAAHALPVSEKLNDVFKQTADYLKANPKRSIKLTGLYAADEENKSIMPNLGLARANDVKEMLVSLGASANQIALDSRMESDLNFTDNNLIGGVNYDFFATPETDKNLEAIRLRLQQNPIILYFKTNSWDLELNEQQRQDFSDLIYYLDRTPKALLESAGHTDDRGDYENNMRISRKRAEFVQDYLKKNGINFPNISASGLGPDEPIADNESPEGRAKNRRVEIRLK